MANKIIIKKSSVATKIPAAGDLEVGELAVNLTDQKLYSKNAGGTVILVGSGLGGSGDVQGPSSATDNALARFDATTGKIIQNGVITEDDVGRLLNILALQFGDGTAESVAAGKLWYNGTTGSWNAGMGGGNITQQIGEELFVYGKASSAISDTNLQLVYQTGTVGASGVLQFAPTVANITDANLIVGVATESIATNGFGRVTAWGIVHGTNTSGSAYGETWADGDVIWYNPTTGGLTKTKPSAPNIKVQIGTVINAAGGGAGSFSVEINHGSVLGGTDSNVQLTSPASGNLLIYDASAGYWKNANITAGTGISVTNGAGSVTIANTGVTSVSGTAPISSSGGATPAISISQASGTTNGYLSSTDWNTFNNKTSNTGTVTSVAMTVPTGLSISGSPITTSGTLALTLTAGYSIPTTASQTNWDSAYTQRLQWDGGSTNLVAASGRTSLGATTLGSNLFTITNPSAITFPRFNADNTVSALDAATFRSAIGAGTSSTTGTVTSITGGSYLTGGTITTSGTLAVDATSANTASKVVARDASGNFSAGTITATLSGNASTATTASSCSGNSATATLATKASTLSQGGGNGSAMTFNWSGQSGQPSWLWGSNDGTNIYVWNPSNFNVNYATTAGSAPANGGTSAACSGNAATATKLSTASGSAPSYSARLWVNFNGTGATSTNQSIRGSANVSTVFKNGTGDYTINFSTAMQDTNYCLTGSSGDATNANQMFQLSANVNYSTGSCRIRTGSGGGYNDNAYVNVLVHR